MVLAPSLISLFLTGILLLTILYLFASNFNQFKKINIYQKLNLLCLITIALGIHGLIHLGVETNYGFNPYNWITQ